MGVVKVEIQNSLCGPFLKFRLLLGQPSPDCTWFQLARKRLFWVWIKQDGGLGRAVPQAGPSISEIVQANIGKRGRSLTVIRHFRFE
jgi:hypothetical protein